MTDRELMQALARREDPAMEALLGRYGGLLRYVIGGVLPHKQEAEDCFGDVCLQLWEKAALYDPEKGALAPWLTALARNAALTRLKQSRRHQARQENQPPPAGPESPEEAAARKDQTRRLKQAVAKMDWLDQQLFWRKYYYLQSLAQMAAELGITQRAAEGRLYRLRRRLKQELGGDQP